MHADSDIDLLITSTDFEGLTWKQEERLWSLTARLDSRLEPFPCSESRWQTDEVSPLIEVARLEGIVIDVDPTVPPHPAREEFVKYGGERGSGAQGSRGALELGGGGAGEPRCWGEQNPEA